MIQDDLEQHWRAILDYAARQHGREKLAELIVKVNHVLDAIEGRMAQLGCSTPDGVSSEE